VQKKRALLHHAQLRLARALEEHASSAPIGALTYKHFLIIETGDFSWNAKSSVNFNIQLSITILPVLTALCNKNPT